MLMRIAECEKSTTFAAGNALKHCIQPILLTIKSSENVLKF